VLAMKKKQRLGQPVDRIKGGSRQHRESTSLCRKDGGDSSKKGHIDQRTSERREQF
jgi:hypothetical protein